MICELRCGYQSRENRHGRVIGVLDIISTGDGS